MNVTPRMMRLKLSADDFNIMHVYKHFYSQLNQIQNLTHEAHDSGLLKQLTVSRPVKKSRAIMEIDNSSPCS